MPPAVLPTPSRRPGGGATWGTGGAATAPASGRLGHVASWTTDPAGAARRPRSETGIVRQTLQGRGDGGVCAAERFAGEASVGKTATTMQQRPAVARVSTAASCAQSTQQATRLVSRLAATRNTPGPTAPRRGSSQPAGQRILKPSGRKGAAAAAVCAPSAGQGYGCMLQATTTVGCDWRSAHAHEVRWCNTAWATSETPPVCR